MIKIVISHTGSFELDIEALLSYFKDFPNSVFPIDCVTTKYAFDEGGLIGSKIGYTENSLIFEYGPEANISFYGPQREITRLTFWVSFVMEKIKQNYEEGLIPSIICLSEDVVCDLFNPGT